MATKYQGQSIISIARERGSSARSKRGAWRYLLSNMDSAVRAQKQSVACMSMSRREWQDAVWRRRGAGCAKSLGYPPDRCEDYRDYVEWRQKRQHNGLRRNAYGALIPAHPQYIDPSVNAEYPNLPDNIIEYYHALDIIRNCSLQSYDNISFDREGRAEGEAMHIEIYDIASDAVLVCHRHTVGSRYGVATKRKGYYLLSGDGCVPVSLPVARYAKADNVIGSIIAKIRGVCDAAKLPRQPVRDAYKAVAIDNDDTIRSIYSGESYTLGRRYANTVRPNHNGGYYSYPTIEQALNCEVPQNSRLLTCPRAIVRCEISGNIARYNNGKQASTYLRPIEIVASVL